MRATHILNYICCTLACTWLRMMPKPQTKIQDWNISWLAQLKNTKNLPNMCSLSKEEPIPFLFFWLAYSLKLWGLHPYSEGRCDLLHLRFSLCVFVEEAEPGGDFPKLREKQRFICSTLFSQHDTSSLVVLISLRAKLYMWPWPTKQS